MTPQGNQPAADATGDPRSQRATSRRAPASAANGGAATMRLRNLVLFGYHGVSPAEREVGTRIEVDVDLVIHPAERDVLTSTVDYYQVYRAVEDVVTSTRFKLLETLARAVRQRLMESFPVQEAQV